MDKKLIKAANNSHLEAEENIHVGRDLDLSLAAEKGNLTLFELLVYTGANSYQDNDSLRSEKERKVISVIEFFLGNGTHFYTLYDDALLMAVDGGHVPALDFLARNGIDIHADWVLHEAVYQGCWPIVDFLLEHGGMPCLNIWRLL